MNSGPLYRSTFVWKTNVAIVAVLFAAFALDAALSTKVVWWVFDGGMCLLMVGLLAWGGRLGVRVEPDGVRIVNMLRQPRLRWDEIDRFELAPGGVYPFVGWVILTGGRRIAITAITVSRFSKQRSLRSAQAPIDALNQLLSESAAHRSPAR